MINNFPSDETYFILVKRHSVIHRHFTTHQNNENFFQREQPSRARFFFCGFQQQQ